MFGLIAATLKLVFYGIYWVSVGPYRVLMWAGKSASPAGYYASRALAFGYLLLLVAMFGACGVLAREDDPLVSYLAFGAMIGVGLMAFIPVSQVRALRREDEQAKSTHGTARLANDDEIKEFLLAKGELMPAGSFYLGQAKSGPVVLPRSMAVKGGVIVGGMGSGKTRGYSMPNAAWVRGTSLALFDPKDELFGKTSGFHKMARKYAPANPNASECFNWIMLCKEARMAELCARGLITPNTTPATEAYWVNGEVALLAALCAHTATLSEPTPLTAYRLLTRQTDAQLEEQLRNSSSEVAQEQALIFYQKTEPKHRNSFTTGVVNALQFMRDPEVARFTSAGVEPPDFGRMRREAMAVYYCVREQDIERLKSLTSLFFTILLEQIAGEEIKEGEPSVPITLILDEFGNLGTIPNFASTLTLARGRDVAIWIYLQALSQLPARYGHDDGKTILNAPSTKVFLNGLDVDTAEYASRMSGDTTVVDYVKSHTKPGIPFLGHSSTTRSRTTHRRRVLTADEVMRIGEDEALIRTGNRRPMILEKIYYDEPACKAEAPRLGDARALNLQPAPSPKSKPKAPPPGLPPSDD